MSLLGKLKESRWQCFAATVVPIVLVILIVAISQLMS